MAGTKPQPKNPYIIGRPIIEQQLFFGRDSLCYFIEDNLRQNVPVILLHGQRRIGKSSVLQQIPKFFANREPQDFIFVNFDLEDKANYSLEKLLQELATEIVSQILDELTLPTAEELKAELETNINFSFYNFLQKIYQILEIRKLVLLLDEFDVLDNKNNKKLPEQDFVSFLSQLIKTQEKNQQNLFIIPVLGRNLEDMSKLLDLFKDAPYQEIGLLDDTSARRLITKPSQGMLEYDEDAQRAILKLSAGHPYCIQIICFTLFGRARELENWKVTRADVEKIVDKSIKSAEAGLDWFWKGLPSLQQLVFSAIAEAQTKAISQNQRVPEDPLDLLRTYGVDTQPLEQAAKELAEKKSFVDDTGRKITVELVRCWMVQRHPLKQELNQLKNLHQQEVESLSKQANALEQKGDSQTALVNVYESILQINPNHFSTIGALALRYVEEEKFDQALELYTRAYKFDSGSYKDKLLRTRQTYGQKLFSQREWTRSKEQFSHILEIDPNNIQAQKNFKEVERLEILEINVGARPVLDNQSPQDQSITFITPSWRRRILFASVGVTLGTISLVGFAIYYRELNPCPAGQIQSFVIRCVPDRRTISRGEQTLFPLTPNSERDKGIIAFKQGKYLEASDFFKKALQVKPKEPEVSIYYNNALAKKQGSPFTFAVVVPADHSDGKSELPDKAREVLRGVAQAQDQFNNKGGLNGRLLEIVIANDSNDPNKAKQVAQDLVTDSSVLGVIGHLTTSATLEVLDIYQNNDLAIISPTSTSTVLHNINDVFFQTGASDEATATRLADYAFQTGIRKVAIFYNIDDTGYSNRLRELFIRRFATIGGTVYRAIEFDNNGTLNNFKKVYQQVDAIVLFPDSMHTSQALQITSFVAQMNDKRQTSNRKDQAKVKLLAGDTLYNGTTLKDGGKSVEELILAVPWFRETVQSQDFANKAENFWEVQEISWRTATSFDATQAFISTLSTKATRSKVLRNLLKVKLDADKTSGENLQFNNGVRKMQPILVKIVTIPTERKTFKFLK